MLKTIRLIFIVVIIFNIAELFSVLTEPATNFLVILINLLLLTVSLFFTPAPIVENILHQSVIRRLFYIIIFSNVLLIYFVYINLDDYSLIGLAIFMERYRNGFYQGSGIFTFLSTNIVPLLMSYFIYYFQINKSKLSMMLFFSIVPVLALGLRVFLIPIFFSLIFKHFNKNKILSKQSLNLLILIVFLIFSTKLLLTPEIYSNNISEAIGKVLTRTNYQAITIPFGINGGWQYLFTGNVDSFKDLYYKQNITHIDRLYFSDISNTSGLAIPLLPLLVIMFGFSFVSVFVTIIFVIIFRIVSGRNNGYNNVFRFKNVFYYYLVVFMLASFIEDYSFVYKIIYIPFLWGFISFLKFRGFKIL
jgi:hypothetical protein